jgi:hypothetical protein
MAVFYKKGFHEKWFLDLEKFVFTGKNSLLLLFKVRKTVLLAL